MKALFSKDVLLSLREVVSLKDQKERSEQAVKAFPDVFHAIKETFIAAPYLVFVYLIIAGIDIQYRIIDTVDAGTIVFSTMVTLALLTAANALCYVEAYNAHTTGERILNSGWYVTRRLLRLVGVILLSSSIISLGVMMFVIPGVYFAVRLSLAAPACIIDDCGLRESMFQSMEATDGQLTMIYTTFGAFAFLFLPFLILLFMSTGWLELVIVILLFGILPPVLHTTLGILYLNGTDGNTIDFY